MSDNNLQQDYEQLQGEDSLSRLLDRANSTEEAQPEQPQDDGVKFRRMEEFESKQTFMEQIPAGILQGANELLDTIDDLVGNADRTQFMDKEGNLIWPRQVSAEEAEASIAEGVPDFTRLPEFDEADTELKDSVRDMTAFLSKFFMARSAIKGGGIVKDMAAGGIADFTTPPDEPGIAELVESLGGKTIVEPLLNDEADPGLVKRTKNFFEGLGFGAVIDTSMRLLKGAGKALVSDPKVIKEVAEEDLLQKSLTGVGDFTEEAPVMGKFNDFIGEGDVSPDDLINKGFVQVESGGDDVFINFARINEPDDVKGLIDTLAQGEKVAIKKAQRGKQSLEQTQALADELGLSVEQVLKRTKGTAYENAETAVAARKLLASSGKNLLNLSKTAASGDATPQQIFAFRRAVAMHKALQSEVLAAQTETARALSSFRIPVDGADSLRAIEATLDNMGGAGVGKKMAQRLAALEASGASAAQINQYLSKSVLAKTNDVISEAFVTGLLWTPSTHIVNGVGNTMSIGFDVSNRRMAEAINKFTRNKGGVAQGEAMAAMYGLKAGFKDAIIHAVRAARGLDTAIGGMDRTVLESGKASRAISSEAFGITPGPLATSVDMLGGLIRAPGAALTLNDEFFKSVGYRMQIHALAWRTATNEGLERTSKEFAERVDDLVKNPSKEIKMEATDAVLYNTFQNKTGALGEGVVKVRGALGPVGTWMLPFARTPVNLFRFSLENSPAAPIVGQWRADFAAGGARKQMALAKMTLGTMYAGVALDLAQAGIITGGGVPRKDRGESQALRRQGLANYSVVVGDKSYPFNRFDPVIATTLGVAADMYDLSGRFDWPEDDEATGMVHAFGIALSRAVTNKTYLKSFGDFYEATTDETGRGMERLTGQIAAASIPGATAVSTIERIVDPELRETMSIMQDIQSRIPGLSQRLIPRRDMWGNTREEAGGGAGPFLPVNPKDLKDSVVDREIFRHNVPTLEIGWKGVSFGGVKMDFNEFPNVLDEYRQLAGNKAKDFNGDGLYDKLKSVMLNKHYESEMYNLRTDGMDGGKSQYIQSQISEFRKLAQQEILTNPKYNDIEEFVRFRRVLKEEIANTPNEFKFQQ